MPPRWSVPSLRFPSVMSARTSTGTVRGSSTVTLLAVTSMGTTTSEGSGAARFSPVRSTVPRPPVIWKPSRACSMLAGDQSALWKRKRSPFGTALKTPPTIRATTAKKPRIPELLPRRPASRIPRPSTAAPLAHTMALADVPRSITLPASSALSEPPTSRARPAVMATAGVPGPPGFCFGAGPGVGTGAGPRGGTLPNPPPEAEPSPPYGAPGAYGVPGAYDAYGGLGPVVALAAAVDAAGHPAVHSAGAALCVVARLLFLLRWVR